MRHHRATRVLRAAYLRGGSGHSNFRIDLQGSSLPAVVLRRWLCPGWDADEPEYNVAREHAVLTMLESADFPAPRVIAADAEGEHCGVPALLVTLLPGGMPTKPVARTPAFTRQLAATVSSLHQIAPPSTGIPGHELYLQPQDLTPPRKSRNPEIWHEAFAVASQSFLGPKVLLHRDFHPGNTLWFGTRLTGVVDWTQASIGHPDVDVGHMRWNLLLSCTPDVSAAFKDDYREIAGRSPDPRWEVKTPVDLSNWPFTRSDLAKIEPELAIALAEVP